MEQMRYMGGIDHLRGKTALVKPHDVLVKWFHVQFDERGVTRLASGQGLDLSHGWHSFRREDFEPVP